MQSSKAFVVPSFPPDKAGQLLGGRTAFATGAGDNIGRGVALELARHGANVLFTDIDVERCEHLEAGLAQWPIVARGFRSDVSSADEVDGLCEALPRWSDTNGLFASCLPTLVQVASPTGGKRSPPGRNPTL